MTLKSPTAGHLQVGDLPAIGGGICPFDGRQVTPFPHAAILSTRGREVSRVCDECGTSIVGKGATEAVRALNLLLAAIHTGGPTLRGAVIGSLRPLLVTAMGDVVDQALVHLLAEPAA